MSKENTKEQRLSPAEQARRLALVAKQKHEQEAREHQAKKTEQYEELKKRLQIARNALTKKRQDLKEVEDGLAEIADIDKEGIMSDDLEKLRIDLVGQKATLETRIREDEQAIADMEADPLHVEMKAAESAAKIEADRVQAAQSESRRNQELREQLERAVAKVDKVVRDISLAIRVAQKHTEDMNALQEEKEQLEGEMGRLTNDIKVDVAVLLHALPEKQELAIADAVEETRQKGKVIYGGEQSLRDNRVVSVPAVISMSEWFAAWREKVTPSIFPFLDKPLRAVLAFEGDARLEKMRELQKKLQTLIEGKNQRIAVQKRTNTKFIDGFLAEDSAASTLNDDLSLLRRFAKGEQMEVVNEQIGKLDNLRRTFNILLTDVGDERYQLYKESPFAKLDLRSGV